MSSRLCWYAFFNFLQIFGYKKILLPLQICTSNPYENLKHLRVDNILALPLKYLEDKEHAYETDKSLTPTSRKILLFWKCTNRRKSNQRNGRVWRVKCNKMTFQLMLMTFGNQSLYALKPLKKSGDFNCSLQFCQFKCSSCKICVHLFSCSCKIYRVRHLVCKHLHLFKIHLPERMRSEISSKSNNPNPSSEEASESYHDTGFADLNEPNNDIDN